jgi:predicted acyltransferase
MAVVGTALLILAQLWNLYFPINKNLWTSSFVLQCGGFSVLLMALFYFIIDVLGLRQWAFFFKVIGMNSILIYMSGQFIDWEYTTYGFFKWFGQLIGNPWNAVAMAIMVIGVKWVFLYFLYRKKVFLRV